MTVTLLHLLQLGLEVAVSIGSICWLAAAVCSFWFARRIADDVNDSSRLPAVSLLKPVYGLEKNLLDNLKTACLQDYPHYQVVFSVQRPDDPALPILRELEREFGPERVTVAVENAVVGKNGKVNNLVGALPHARHELLVISDSDAHLEPDFLARIVAPLADPKVGAVTTFFRGVDAERWFERLELLGLNVDQFAMAMLAHMTRLASFCFGVSTAFKAETLRAIGGFEALGNYLVEDTEMGRRIRRLGKRVVAAHVVVDVTVDLPTFSDYAQKQVYWDHNTLAAAPGLFFGSFCLRIVPLALALACFRGFDGTGASFLVGAIVLRGLSAAAVLGVALDDRFSMRSLWLLPVKDLLGVFWSCRAVLSRQLTWRGVTLSLDARGQLQERRP